MADDSSPDRPDDGEPNPFAGFPMFGDLARALQGQGPLNWDAARQFAMLGATEGHAEHNVDPAVRIAYGDLARIAGMHVNDVTGSDTAFPEPRIVTRSQWAAETLEAYRPLFTDLATSLGQQPDEPGADAGDPMLQMMAGISKMMQPAMMGMSVGSMVGALSKRVFGLHDLPIPRGKQEVVLVGRTIDDFAGQWEIPLDQMRLWVLAHELSGFQVFAVDGLREALAALVRSYAGGFRPDPTSLAESPEQRALRPRLDAAVAAVVGYTDWVVDAVAVRVIGGEALRIAEAVRRQRVELTPDDIFVEKLLGIRVGDDQVARGKAFVQGVVDRVGEHGLTRLLQLPDALPTPNELDAPGLWIARVSGE